jgi:hypothetical protein
MICEVAGEKQFFENLSDDQYHENVCLTAATIGLDSKDDSNYAIAEALLNLPLPASWLRCLDEKSRIFYFDSLSSSSTWVHPLHTPMPADSVDFKLQESLGIIYFLRYLRFT